MVQDNDAHPGTAENSSPVTPPPIQISLKDQILAIIDQMRTHVQRSDVIGVALVVAQRDGVPQHGYVAGPFASALLIGGMEMAKSELIEGCRP